MARARVRRSAYSSSPPMGTPVAMRLMRTPKRAQQLGEVDRRRFALHAGIRRHDDFSNGVATAALDQFGDTKIVGADAIQGREHAVKDVVAAAVAPRAARWRSRRGWATTHSRLASRRWSRQMAQGSSSVKSQQVPHSLIFARRSAMAAASAVASFSGARRM